MIRDRREQILSALMPLLEDTLGIDRDELPRPDERIDEHLKRLNLWDEFDHLDLLFRCERTFGINITRYELTDFFNGGVRDPVEWEQTVAPRLTYEAFADFIAERVPVVTFDPVEIAGVHCAKAGAFFGLRELVKHINEAPPRFAPSTPIRECLCRSDLFTLWYRLEWMSDASLPPLRTRWVDRAWSLIVLACLGLFGTGIAAFLLGAAAVFLHGLSLLKASWTLLKLAERFENPLPAGIVTFGDLARWLAEPDADADAVVC